MREEIKERAKRLAEVPLCDACFGRRFAKIGYGMSNAERGRMLKGLLFLDAIFSGDIDTIRKLAKHYEPARRFLKDKLRESIEAEKCSLCNGLLSDTFLSKLADKVAREVLEKEIEFFTFSIGSRGLDEYIKKEEELRSKYPTPRGESLKHEFNRSLAKRLAKILDKEPTIENPDVVIIVSPEGLSEIVINPVYIKGRYRKLKRGIYQARQNRRLPEPAESVEELIGEVAKEFFKADDYKLHAAGREDVDVRMLGSGRPFVLELVRPRKRRVDLKELEKAINERNKGKIEVTLEGYATRKDVRELKEKRHKKLYYAIVRVPGGYTEEDLKKVLELKGKIIEQRTPLRVAHRRADRVRRRKVYDISVEPIDEERFGMRILADGGLYIKELIHGDKGRTRPSVAEILGKEAICESLDVLEVIDE